MTATQRPENTGPVRPGVTIAGHYSSLVLPEPPPGRPFVYINMVTSVDGKATVDGSERGLGSPDDQRMMHELRVHADAVINGASTLRISGSSPRVRDAGLKAQRKQRGLAPQAMGVVVTRSGDLPLDAPFFTSKDYDAVVVVVDTTPQERVSAISATGRHVITVPDRPDNGAEIVRTLRDRFGVRHLLCEGGPTLNQTFLLAEVADELFLTIAPWIVAGEENLTAAEGAPFHRLTMPRLRLLQYFHDQATDELFLRYAISYRG